MQVDVFQNTLAISNTVVVNCSKTCLPGGAVKLDQRGKSTPTNKIPQDSINYVVQHISSIPSYESHYCQEKTQHRYLGPHLNKEKMYNLCLQFCKENNIHEGLTAPKWKYFEVFDKSFKLSLKLPEVDL